MVSQNRQPQSFGRQRTGPSSVRRPVVSDPLLAELCGLYGVQTGYRDTRGKWRESPTESIVAVLRALGADLGDGRTAGDREVSAAIRERKRELGSRLIEPVLVAWNGKFAPPDICAPTARGRRPRSGARLTVTLEDGTEMQWESPIGGEESGPVRRLPRLPHGYHKLAVECGTSVTEATVISAPRKCWRPECEPSGQFGHCGQSAHFLQSSRYASAADRLGAVPTGPLDVLEGRQWGIFAPLYALRSERDWGAGDLAELRALRDRVAARGGCAVSTLPLLAMFFDEPFDPSPYRPVSRLFWNEFYLAVEEIPEWERCAAARELWASADFQAELHALRDEPLVDHRGVMGLKRRVLERMAEDFFSNSGREGRDAATARRQAFERHLREQPLAQEYASFRAQCENHPTADSGDAAARYHLYCQWQMEEQLGRISGAADAVDRDAAWRDRGRPSAGLFLDLPLGGHPDGFDTWRWPELFARGMSAGAPPDDFFALGQDWTLPPLHPGRIREGGHEYFARCIRHHMSHAAYLRIDHIMSLHRLFWVPEGREATDGVYVDYPAEESYAVLCLESHRNRTVVVGEDLGTVPPGVRSTMKQRGVLRSWVFQASLRPRAAEVIASVPRDAVASVNTHDMFPFAGFLQGRDIETRLETGQLDPAKASREMAVRRQLVRKLAAFLPMVQKRCTPTGLGQSYAQSARQADVVDAELLCRALLYIAAVPVALIMVNLEDFLSATEPQNVPGTGVEWNNWRRKATLTVSETADTCRL